MSSLTGPALILLNGPPASGKSTLAALLAAARPLTLNLDVDVVRGQLGGWLDDPYKAGLVARDLALAMALRHLATGHDVIVPQFLTKVDFIEQLEQAATVASATFVEITLTLDRDTAVEAFERRSADPRFQSHRDATSLVERSTDKDPVGDMYDQLQELMSHRSDGLQVLVIRDDIEATYAALTTTLSEAGTDW